MPCAFALHLAFPRANLLWLAPLALGGLFASWMMLPPRTAIGVGYLAGIVFFASDFSWFGESAAALLGPFGFVLDVGPALLEALAFAAAAGITALASARLHGLWLAAATASAFTLTEILRSSGTLGVPLYQVGAPFVDSPLAPLAAFAGVYGLTFAVALAAAGLGAFAIASDRSAAAYQLGAIVASVAGIAFLTWLAWGARSIAPGNIRVAAIQGNIAQSIKWEPRSLPRAVHRYMTMTAAIRNFKPQFVLWPETVITTDLLIDPVLTAQPANARFAADAHELRQRFSALATSLDATVAVGSDEATAAGSFNDLIFFRPGGDAERPAAYRKRQLVPFAEFLPGPGWLRNVPFASLVSDFHDGDRLGPFGGTLNIAPLICWEAGFGDLAQAQVAVGARFFAIATDDAWFGQSDGPYAQAQLAQLRAIENGRWVVRAGATGISGIIAPNGQWQKRSALNTQAAITGTIGAPQPTLYSRLGPGPVSAAAGLLLCLSFGLGRRRPGR